MNNALLESQYAAGQILYKELGFTKDGKKEDKMATLKKQLKVASTKQNQVHHLVKLNKQYRPLKQEVSPVRDLLMPGTIQPKTDYKTARKLDYISSNH